MPEFQYPPKVQLCDRCVAHSPEGTEKEAVIQLVGEWLCKPHYEMALEMESAYVKMRVRQAGVRR